MTLDQLPVFTSEQYEERTGPELHEDGAPPHGFPVLGRGELIYKKKPRELVYILGMYAVDHESDGFKMLPLGTPRNEIIYARQAHLRGAELWCTDDIEHIAPSELHEYRPF